MPADIIIRREKHAPSLSAADALAAVPECLSLLANYKGSAPSDDVRDAVGRAAVREERRVGARNPSTAPLIGPEDTPDYMEDDNAS